MANTKSAKKALRVSVRRNKFNKGVKTSYREAKKAVMDLVKSNDIDEAKALLPKAYKEIDKAAKVNILNKRKAASLKSELTKALNEAGKGTKSEPKSAVKKAVKKTTQAKSSKKTK